MRFLFSLLLCFVLLWGSIEAGFFRKKETEEDRFRSRFDVLQKEAGRVVKKRHKVEVYGSGGGALHAVTKVYLAFQSFEPMSVEKGRLIFVDGVETLRLRFNEDEQIRPHLAEYPFGLERISVHVSYMPHEGPTSSPVDFVLYNRSKGIIHYQKTLLNEESYSGWRLTTVFSEPYEEAKEIVMRELGPGGAEWIPDDWIPGERLD